MEQTIQRLRKRLGSMLAESGACTDEEVQQQIDELIFEESKRNYYSLVQKCRLREELFCSVRKLDILQELLDDPAVMEIMVNGYDTIFVEREGRITRYGKSFSSKERLEDVIQKIVSGCNRVVNETMPIADARLPGGERIHAVLPPVSLNGPVLTIRRFPDEPMTMDRLIRMGSITQEAAGLLEKLVVSGYSIMIAGATSAGKTTFLNALSAYIPPEERIITIEDTAELQLRGAENLIRLETKTSNMRENLEITIRDLIRASLRMRPDRLIVGEVRGGEALDFLQAVNTGHEGSICTIHANSPADTVSRLETLVLMSGMQLPLEAIRHQIASGIEVFIQLGRDHEGKRGVTEIAETVGCEDGQVRLHTLYRRDGKSGELKQEEPLLRREKLERYRKDETGLQ